ncbi:TetR/AcrR family transcriptional regulator [Parafrankia sp. BMG5.11]|uniref:TetR/AcrR family transcriptional regulator n=1 Tax=Parafrankia sp. BMG5.11 TaxID=222540 RepID=UPI00103F0BBD|nr:TetR/AcrR family transcriptional regulator [Parafrankia sp. BMG5.11]TCJ37093.1 TetR/AcrR family transcriptional regulator [Parafrankia sp. BMG5.11]
MGEGTHARPSETDRFERRRQDVIHAASALINELGVKGTTFAELARSVGLNATSITYYFDRKDKLVVAVYEATLEWLEAAAAEAAAQPTPQERVRSFVRAHVALRRRIRGGESGLITALSEIRTLGEAAQAPLLAQYARVLDHVRAFFGDGRGGLKRSLDTARAHILLEAMFWWPVWSLRYSTHDFDRLEARMFDIFARGLAGEGQGWSPQTLANESWRGGDDDDATGAFLRSATVMINQRGYRGASVNRIAAALNVTKGSFYHHHNAKDDLVFACFQRSYDRLSAVQLAARELAGDGWTRTASALAELIDLQFHDPMPLLRTTALQALPMGDRGSVVVRSNRLANRFAGMLSDGIADGSVRAVDPLVASQLIMPALNAAYEARGWAARQPDPALAVKLYAWTLCAGVFTDPPEVG